MANQEVVQFRCTIKKMFNGCPKESGWFGCFAHIRAKDKDIKLTGMTHVNLINGMQLDVSAYKKDDGSYDIIEFTVVTKTKTGLISYLSSLPGVSRDTAMSIVKLCGDNTLQELKDNPDNIKSSLQLTDKQMASIIKGVNNADAENTLQKFLPELSPRLIKRVKGAIDNPIQKIQDNPYILHDIPGISFPLADTIAMRLGIQPMEPFRVNHGLIHILQNESSGNLYVNLTNTDELQKLCAKVEQLLHIRFVSIQDFAYRLIALNAIKNSPIYIEKYNNEQHLYLQEIYIALTTVVNRVNRLKSDTSKFKQIKASVTQQINWYQASSTFTLVPEQRAAVTNALNHKISIITGGPGRGKTSVIDCIAKCWIEGFASKEKLGHVLLLAPTGKAMNKLRTATKSRFETMTIDKLIVSMEKSGNKSLSSIDNSSTIIIIDESSMLDIVKASALLSLMHNCQFCFVGDIDQLPPISPGHFLKSLIESGKIPTTYLKTPLRNGGLILSNAELINDNDCNLKYDVNEMPFFPQQDDDDAALDAVLEQYNEERESCPDITQIALLSPVRKGKLGTVSLNMAIQEATCPLNINGLITYDKNHDEEVITTKGYPINSTIYGNGQIYTRFRIGDIIINTKNNNSLETYTYTNNDYWNKKAMVAQMGVFNGDCGRIIGYVPNDENNDGHDVIIVQFFDNRFARFDVVAGDFEHFDLGYAITVHKAQGCEYDTVIYISPKSLETMANTGFATKNLVYTAVTRAKNRVVIMGSKESLNTCIKNNIPKKNSNLAQRIT